MTQDNKKHNSLTKRERLRAVATTLGFIGFFMLLSAVGTEDNRDKMSAERAKTELPSPWKSLAKASGGVALMFCALGFSKKADKEKE